MNIIETLKYQNPSEEVVLNDISLFIEEASKYKPSTVKYGEIISFLLDELKRIAEFNIERDIQKYKKAIEYYMLEDQGFHDEAMNLKLNFYSRGGKFPFLPMVNIFSFIKQS